jgi:hypothetical protein
VWGLQAKYFQSLGTRQKAQLAESVTQAAANYPSLQRYTICVPFTPTAKTGAKAGKPRMGQHEKLAAWIDEWKVELAKAGRTIEFDLWDESELLGRLAAADVSGGLSRFWFEHAALTPTWFDQRLADANGDAIILR